MEYPGSSVVIRQIRQIVSRILRFDHMSRSLAVSSLVCQDTLVLVLIYVFDWMLNCSFYGVGSRLRLDFFCFVLLT